MKGKERKFNQMNGKEMNRKDFYANSNNTRYDQHVIASMTRSVESENM